MPKGEAPRFERYIGVDYSGAATPTSSLPGLRVYAADGSAAPHEVEPSSSPRKHWTRRGIAEWLVEELVGARRSLVGIDHGFGFPLSYFREYRLPLDWPLFLEEFRRNWPTDEDGVRVDHVRKGDRGHGAALEGDARWRRLTELRAGAAKSVFHFDVPGSVAKSTHAGLPWLDHLRRKAAGRIHCWPFDGWSPPSGRSVIAEVYPSLWHHGYPRDGRTADQHDAWVTARWLQEADRDGSLEQFFHPPLSDQERVTSAIEGWILGVM